MSEYQDIMRMERARTGGYGGGIDDTYPICPMCGKESDAFYRNKEGYYFGCDNCVQAVYCDEISDEVLRDMSKWSY